MCGNDWILGCLQYILNCFNADMWNIDYDAQWIKPVDNLPSKIWQTDRFRLIILGRYGPIRTIIPGNCQISHSQLIERVQFGDVIFNHMSTLDSENSCNFIVLI